MTLVIYGYLLVPAQINYQIDGQIDDQMTMLIPMAFGDMSKVGWCRGHSDGVWSIGDTVGVWSIGTLPQQTNPSHHNKPKHSILCGLETQLRLLLKINHNFCSSSFTQKWFTTTLYCVCSQEFAVKIYILICRVISFFTIEGKQTGQSQIW